MPWSLSPCSSAKCARRSHLEDSEQGLTPRFRTLSLKAERRAYSELRARKEGSEEQRYTFRVLQTIQMKLILLCVWAERAVLGSTKTALEFKYEI